MPYHPRRGRRTISVACVMVPLPDAPVTISFDNHMGAGYLLPASVRSALAIAHPEIVLPRELSRTE